MICPRNRKPYGYCIQHSNNPEEPRWLVCHWGLIIQVCMTLGGAYLWLKEELGID